MKRIFGIPLLIGIASLIGLVSGLVSDGAGDVIAWVGLAVPLILIGWALRFRAK